MYGSYSIGDAYAFNNSLFYSTNTGLFKLDLSTLSIQDLEITSLKIYPNPSEEYIKIQNKENSIGKFEYKIVDLTGRIIKTGNSKFNEKINLKGIFIKFKKILWQVHSLSF